MQFFAPTHVYLEKNCVDNHKQELLSYGKRAFIITGKHSSAVNGSLADVLAVLDETSVPYLIYNDIEENPSVETVAKAAAEGKEFQADFVIGIGGGSPLDAAKAIALLIANPQEDACCLYEPKDLKALPVIAIPTTCGTGSEVTPNAVLTRHAFKTKKSISYNIYPELALVDGKYLASANGRLLIHTAVDALAHCVESRLHAKANVYNHMFSEYGLSLWGQLVPVLEQIAAGPDAVPSSLSDEDLEAFMLASTVAGMAIAQTTTSLPHAISYEITYNHGVPHGKACGIFLAAYMDEYARNNPEDVNRVLSLLGFDSTESFGEYLRRLLGSVAITEEESNLYADNIMANASKLSTYPFPIDREAILRILTCSLDVTA
ncbi:Long-chain primary alcohol dehydrogenase AdhA [Eubacteriaceae bacterium CHKCI004]|nr:Long-chain primary alcohol dehydrogenase AdhA [Eubacteriaceae bacterium CHKCI004]